MHRHALTATAVAALAALSALPAGAESDPVACAAPGDGVTVVTVDDYTGTIAAPLLADDVTEQRFQLDLSPATLQQRAPVSADLSWTIAANDFDLAVLDADGNELGISEGFQPLDPATESVSAGKLAHCSEFTVRVINYQAVGVPAPVDTLDLSLTVGRVA